MPADLHETSLNVLERQPGYPTRRDVAHTTYPRVSMMVISHDSDALAEASARQAAIDGEGA
jgi:hypothetical protein